MMEAHEKRPSILPPSSLGGGQEGEEEGIWEGE